MELAQEHLDKLPSLKAHVEASYKYFKKNADRYAEFMCLVFCTALSSDDITKLKKLKKPILEFNILEATVSRLRGEFAKQEPGIIVRASDSVTVENMTPDFTKMLDFLGNHLREMITDSSNDGLQYNVYTDILGGGYSVVEVYPDYINELSFDKTIKVKRVFDPTMTGFDPLARESHKGDGLYCFQLIPYTKEQFEGEFGKEALQDVKFARGEGFNWSYKNGDQDIILICDFYLKTSKRTKIVKLTNGHIVAKKHYKDQLLPQWELEGIMAQPPQIVEERWSHIESIVRYRFCESKVLGVDETDYKQLPLIFIDGNSVEIKDSSSNCMTQMTRPYTYNAKGIQKLKNFSGQSVASEIENMVQHKFIISNEAIPSDYQEAYKNVQLMDVLVYNQFYEGDTSTPLAPPREVQRTMTPPIVEATFMGADRVTQAILGSYDDVLSQQNGSISGVAITQGAIQSSSASTPYLMGYIKGLNRICEVVLDLIPKYYVTPRSLPIMTADGKRSYQVINKTEPLKPGQHPDEAQQVEGSLELSYKPHELNVKVEAGVNSAIQKQVALDQIIRMTQASPLFAEFINTYGLEPILDNMDIRGIETLKASAAEFMAQKKKQMEEAAAQQGQQDPQTQIAIGMVEAEMQKNEVAMAQVAQRAEQAQGELAIKAAALSIDKVKADAQVMKIMADIGVDEAKLGLSQEKVDSENARSAIEMAMNITEKREAKAVPTEQIDITEGEF